MVYRMTIRNTKLKYPIVPPEGHPDVYRGRMPRPVYARASAIPLVLQEKTSQETEQQENQEETLAFERARFVLTTDDSSPILESG